MCINLLYFVIFQRGDGAEEILQLINEEQCINDNSVDYFQLCAAILTTKAYFNLFSGENGRIKSTHKTINTHTYTRKKGNFISLCIYNSQCYYFCYQYIRKEDCICFYVNVISIYIFSLKTFYPKSLYKFKYDLIRFSLNLLFMEIL